jgi:hypothetical protein
MPAARVPDADRRRREDPRDDQRSGATRCPAEPRNPHAVWLRSPSHKIQDRVVSNSAPALSLCDRVRFRPRVTSREAGSMNRHLGSLLTRVHGSPLRAGADERDPGRARGRFRGDPLGDPCGPGRRSGPGGSWIPMSHRVLTLPLAISFMVLSSSAVRPQSPGVGSESRQLARLPCHGVRQCVRTVLFGGTHGNDPDGETWEWNGSTWSSRPPRDHRHSRRHGL